MSTPPARAPWTCPRCGAPLAPHAYWCPLCTLTPPFAPSIPLVPSPFVPSIPLVPSPFVPSIPLVPSPFVPFTPQPCMFDGLPPGIYDIYCPCPRHSAQCSTAAC